MALAHKLQLNIIIDWCLSAANARLSRPHIVSTTDHILASHTDSSFTNVNIRARCSLYFFLSVLLKHMWGKGTLRFNDTRADSKEVI